jgi:hypothetical protein
VVVVGSGCLNSLPPTEVICDHPNIRVGDYCCLDQNKNNICDKEESPTTTIQKKVNENTTLTTQPVDLSQIFLPFTTLLQPTKVPPTTLPPIASPTTTTTPTTSTSSTTTTTTKVAPTTSTSSTTSPTTPSITQIHTLDNFCDSDTYNCDDFQTHSEAQVVYEFCGGVQNDIHKLDRDKNGIACESLP